MDRAVAAPGVRARSKAANQADPGKTATGPGNLLEASTRSRHCKAGFATPNVNRPAAGAAFALVPDAFVGVALMGGGGPGEWLCLTLGCLKRALHMLGTMPRTAANDQRDLLRGRDCQLRPARWIKHPTEFDAAVDGSLR